MRPAAQLFLGLSALFAGLSGVAAWIAWLNLADSGAHPSFLVGGAASAACSGLFLSWALGGLMDALRQLRLARDLRREGLVREVMDS